MGRPPSNGGPSFRFNQAEIAEMEAILQAHRTAMPERQVLVSLAEKFSNSEERLGKIEVQMKQVWNWFQNRRYAIRAKAAKSPGKIGMPQTARDEVKGVPQATQPHAASSATIRSLPQAAQHPTIPSASVRTLPQAPQHPPAFSVQTVGRVADNSQMEYEAKSARDGAWYDVSTFLSHRSLETGDPEVLVRFAGFGAEEDEWVNVRKNVRQRSLPCESSECVAVLPADLILCFQEGKEQALYFDAHVLDAQRRRHDVRGCRCRFLVRYDHDQSEEIVALRKICRRPETDYRLQQLHAVNDSISANQNKNGANNNIHTVSTLRVYPPAEVQPKQQKVESVVPPSLAEAPQKRQRLDSTVLPDRSQRQFKVEPVALADVPQNQQGVQPPVAALGHKVEPAPPAQPLVEAQRAEPVVPSASDLGSLEPKKVEPVVPLLSAQDSGESQNVVSVGPTISDAVPLDTQKVQPVMPDPSTEVLVEPHKVESNVPSSSEAKQELQTVETNVGLPLSKESEEHHKVEPGPSGEVPEVGPANPPSADALVGSNEADPMVPGAEKEPVVSGSSVSVPAELHEVQHVPDELHTSTLEAKTKEPMLLVSTNEPNVVEVAVETKTEEPVVHVSTDGPNMVEAVETKTEGPVVPVPTDDPKMVEAVDTETEGPVVPVSTDDPNVVEVKTEESVVPVSGDDMNVAKEAIEAKTEEPVVHESADGANMVEAIETKTKEPVVPVSTDGPNMVEAKSKEPVVPVSTDGPNVVEAKTEEPVVLVSSNDMNVVEEAIEAKTEEPVVPVSTNDHNVVQEAKTKEPVVPTNDPNVIEAEIEQPNVSDLMDCSEDRQGNVAEDAINSTVENSDLAPENAAVPMEEG